MFSKSTRGIGDNRPPAHFRINKHIQGSNKQERGCDWLAGQQALEASGHEALGFTRQMGFGGESERACETVA